MENNKGFTLIELLIVIAIIGILAAIAIPSYVGQQKKAARTEAYSNLQNLRLLEERYYAEYGVYTITAADVAAITALLPGFQPGTGTSFTYAITKDSALTTPVPVPFAGGMAAQTPCFVAVASGITNSRVCPSAANCDVFAIDCNNNRNF